MWRDHRNRHRVLSVIGFLAPSISIARSAKRRRAAGARSSSPRAKRRPLVPLPRPAQPRSTEPRKNS